VAFGGNGCIGKALQACGTTRSSMMIARVDENNGM
jgi:hypothetical protein